ncbi:olfactory receptor 4C3D-like [Dama dama]|uniref:olfactory receptor 4C13-like n=1 Tax=Dama dama TaxID=30532 RepID=UPI002A367F4D|nr:olfactory receptor 4C13-like [Dama dama]
MPPKNVTELVLLGLTQNPHLQKIQFIVLLFIFLFTVMINLLIVITISLSSILSKAAMYFFLTHLSFIDATLTSVTTPKITIDLLYQRTAISWGACLTQLFLEHFLEGSEVIVLTVVAYGRYVAISKPLRYTTITRQGLCQLLVVVAWIRGILYATVQILFMFMFNLTFCGHSVIDHFMCDFFSLMELACSDTYRLGMVVAANTGGMCLLIFSMPLVSYIVILSSLKSHSSEGQRRALSTCCYTLQKWYFFFWSVYIHLHASCGHLSCRQVGGCVLCNPHSPVKSYHLHSEKGRSEKCCEEFVEEESNLSYSQCHESDDLYTNGGLYLL